MCYRKRFILIRVKFTAIYGVQCKEGNFCHQRYHMMRDGMCILKARKCLRKNMSSFLAFDSPEGQRKIKFVYEPKGFKVGGIVSGVAFILMFL